MRSYLLRVSPVLAKPYQDMRIMLEGAGIVATNGMEGFWKTVDEQQLRYNYPRTWACLGFLGAGPGSLIVWTALATISWAAAVHFILRVTGFPHGRKIMILTVIALFLNPSVFLALERANTDLLIFGASTLLCGLQAIYTRRAYQWVLLPCFWALVLLKFYPILLLPLVWLTLDGKPRLRIALVLGAAACVALLLPDLLEVARRTQQVAPASYGVSVIKLYAVGPDTNYAGKLLGSGADLRVVGLIVAGASYALALGMVILSPVIARKWCTECGTPKMINLDEAIDRFWLAGSLIYAGTFLLGANYDYRLIFLLLTVPWHVKHGGMQAKIHIGLLLVLLWGWYLPRDFMPARFGALTAQWLLFLETSVLLFWQLRNRKGNSLNENRTDIQAS